MAIYDVRNRIGAINFLAKVGIEPYWDSEGENGPRPLFRKVAKQGTVRVTDQKLEKVWPQLIELLELSSWENADRARKEVRALMGKSERKRK